MAVRFRGVHISSLLALVALSTTIAPGFAEADDGALRELQDYGFSVASSALPGPLKFEAAIQTMDRPMRAYKLTFATSSPALLKSPNADTDRDAFLRNSGNTELWQRKFCSKSLIPIMLRHGMDLVSAHLLDSKGEVQGIAICPRDVGVVAALYPSSEPGLDFEDGEARTWLDMPATTEGEFSLFAIRRNGESYAMYRVGRDQILEAIPVRRAGVRFIVSGDPQGAYYIVRSDGLGICDSRGCSRIARIDKSAPKYRDGEIEARTDERIAELEAKPKIKTWSLELVEARGKSAMTNRTPEAAIDPAKRAEITQWFSESLPSLRALGQILSSVQAQKKDIQVSSTERVRFCNEALARPPSGLGASGDLELDAAALPLRSKTLEALKICASGNDIGAQILVGQAMSLSFRLDSRLRALGILAP